MIADVNTEKRMKQSKSPDRFLTRLVSSEIRSGARVSDRVRKSSSAGRPGFAPNRSMTPPQGFHRAEMLPPGAVTRGEAQALIEDPTRRPAAARKNPTESPANVQTRETPAMGEPLWLPRKTPSHQVLVISGLTPAESTPSLKTSPSGERRLPSVVRLDPRPVSSIRALPVPILTREELEAPHHATMDMPWPKRNWRLVGAVGVATGYVLATLL